MDVDRIWAQHVTEMPSIDFLSFQFWNVLLHALAHARWQEGVLQRLYEEVRYFDDRVRGKPGSFISVEMLGGVRHLRALVLVVLTLVAVPVHYDAVSQRDSLGWEHRFPRGTHEDHGDPRCDIDRRNSSSPVIRTLVQEASSCE